MPNKDDKLEGPQRAEQHAPDLRHLMASVIRLMASCATSDCPGERQTLQHLLAYLLKHPGMADVPAAREAVRRAALVYGGAVSQRADGGLGGLH